MGRFVSANERSVEFELMNDARDEQDRAQRLAERVARTFLALHKTSVSLDDIGEVTSDVRVGSVEAEAILSHLESLGIEVNVGEALDLRELLIEVLRAARALRALGERASSERIAEHTGRTAREVRVALLYAEVLSKG